ncbi:SRPBCC family protein [Iamia sp. SCSIO 61187]|uniref:SRPBCC family protein n=1 Tax=Iamia sp. SCSIO 61187 TaxID=2722752 RepID=UPI001C6295C4|nr:SRPBCC family protein [Iamia sp. SCSIO 61187]QYG91014.1 SRPBCC family protein [Iamia sp. SCSIO 61187]
MRYRDCPTVEVTQRMAVDAETAWAAVTDITLPARFSPELQEVAWLDGATAPAVGARFQGRNRNEHLGEWTTTCTVVELDPPRRWTWEVSDGDEAWSTWGFEVDPVRDGVVVRQWLRIGPARSGLSIAIDAMPDREARIIEVRLAEHRAAMQANLDGLRTELEG